MRYLLLTIIPLLLLIPNIDSSAEHDQLSLVYKDDRETICRDNQVLIYHYNKADYICTSEKNSQLWINLGMAEKVETLEPEIDEEQDEIKGIELPEEFVSTHPIDDIRAKYHVVRFSSGDLTKTISFDTFGRVQAGEDKTFIRLIETQGFSYYFLLESLPSKDKAEFYEIIGKYINRGKKPEPFDVTIDTVAGNGKVIVTTYHPKCHAIEYTVYLQNWIFFYPFANQMTPEFRDHTVFYCRGINMEVHNDERRKTVFPQGVPNLVPNDDDRVKSVIVHFFDGELKEVHTVHTFTKVSPAQDSVDTPYTTLTAPAYPFGSAPQFFLESLPSKDKHGFYEFLSRYINPVKKPELFNVSIDYVTGDGTILQRWNYVKCDVTDYRLYVAENFLSFPFSDPAVMNVKSKADLVMPYQQDEITREIRDKTDFQCSGLNLESIGDKPINSMPIFDVNYKIRDERPQDIGGVVPPRDERASYYEIRVMGGEFTQTHSSNEWQKFEALSRDRGPYTPANAAKQYEFGFQLESLPTLKKTDMYEFFSRYINPGKTPEPFDVEVDLLTGNGTLIETIKYASCESVEFDWYLQELMFIWQFIDRPQEEVREKYTVYCTGLGVIVPPRM